MERKAFTSLTEASMRVLLGETHMIGKTVIVKGKKGKVIEQVGSDGKTESDEIYQVKFEDGTVADIPARDMEMQGDDNKKIGENEAEELVKEAKKVRVKTQEYGGEHLDEKIVTGKDGVKRLKGAFHWPSEVIRPSGRRKAKPSQLPRQLKNRETEMMVSHPKTGAVSVIDKKDWEEHEKQGYGVAESVEHLDEATKAEKKARQVQNRTASAYARQKTELEPGEKTAKFNRLANQLDKLRKLNDHVELDEWGTSYDQDAQIGDIVKKDRKKADARTRQQWKDMQKEKEKAVPETKRKKEMTNKKHNNDISN